ncbi:helix-turn-helix transcriptional regulator [Undibacterium sp. JH2W]|uniref:helix-turn-helix transcriptional regulator n=1 Tax=Undibacterium sp. JH2W TaxID=3413037 RepID=UPI003BF24F68
MQTQPSIQLWRLPRVIAETGLSKSEIYRRIKEGTFVPQIKLGARAIAFDSSAVQAWIKSVIQGAAK